MDTKQFAGFTKGPIKAQSRGMTDGAIVIKDAEFNELCVIREQADRRYGKQNDTDMANAELFAAAPALLAEVARLQAVNAALVAALDYVVQRVDALPPDDPGKLDVPRAHIHMRNAAEQARAALAATKA